MVVRVLALLLLCLLAVTVRAQHGTVQSASGSTATVRLNEGFTVESGTTGNVYAERKGTRMLAARLRACRVDGRNVSCTVGARSEEFDLEGARVEFSAPVRLGRLRVRPTPADARVRVDGEGTLDAGSLLLAPGDYTVRVDRAGYQPLTLSATVEAGRTTERPVQLRRIPRDPTERSRESSTTPDRTRGTRVIPFRKCSAQPVPLPPSRADYRESVLRVTSSPDSAVVRVNDAVRGVTPLDVRVSSRSIVVQLEGNDGVSELDSLDIAPGTWRHEHYELGELPDMRRASRRRAALVVSSTPPGASITVDGERQGITPRRVEADPGSVVLEVSLTKHYTRIDTLQLDAGERRAEHYCLGEKRSPLDVLVYPWGAMVYVDERPAGRTPLSTTIPWGYSTIRVERQGYVSLEDTVFAWGGPPRDNVEATLQPAAGWLRVRSDADGAEVRLDGVRVGPTPLDLRVPRGGYEVTIVDGTAEMRERVFIPADGDETVHADSPVGPHADSDGAVVLDRERGDAPSPIGGGPHSRSGDPMLDSAESGATMAPAEPGFDPVQELLVQGRTFFFQGDYETARARFIEAQDLDRSNVELAEAIGEADAILARLARLRPTQLDTLAVYRTALRESAIVDDTEDIQRIAGLLLDVVPGDPATLHLLRRELALSSPPVLDGAPGPSFAYVFGVAEYPTGKLESEGVDHPPRRGFLLSTTEITNEHFAAFLNDLEMRGVETEHPPVVRNPVGLERDRQRLWQPRANDAHAPVVDATWYGARAYAEWVGGRLPTRVEWLWAYNVGRALSSQQPGGDENGAHVTGIGRDGPAPVGATRADGLGLFYMAGNAWEWVGDTPRESGSRSRYVMGGSFRSLRRRGEGRLVDQRHVNEPNGDVGFRVLLPLK